MIKRFFGNKETPNTKKKKILVKGEMREICKDRKGRFVRIGKTKFYLFSLNPERKEAKSS